MIDRIHRGNRCSQCGDWIEGNYVALRQHRVFACRKGAGKELTGAIRCQS